MLTGIVELGSQTDTRLGRIMRDDRRGETHSAVPSSVCGERSGGGKSARTYPEHARPIPREQERGREKEKEKENTGTRSIYSAWTLARSPARIRRWAPQVEVRTKWGGWTDAVAFPSPLVGDHTCGVCIHRARRAGQLGRLLGGRRSNTCRVQTCRERGLPKIARELCEPIDRSIDRWGSYRAS